MGHQSKLIDDFNKLAESANETELAVYSSIISSLQSKRELDHYSYISNLLKLEATFNKDGRSLTMTMPNNPLVHNELDIAHGGMIATMVDSAMGSLANYSVPEGYVTVTSDLQIRYIKPATGDLLTCKCELIHKGSKTIVVESKTYREDGKLCAVSTGNFFVVQAGK